MKVTESTVGVAGEQELDRGAVAAGFGEWRSTQISTDAGLRDVRARRSRRDGDPSRRRSDKA
jgi:hypothetical protein